MRPGCGVVDRRRERRRRGLEPLREFGFDEPRDAAVRDAERRRRQLGGGHAGHAVDEFVRLVDDEQLVFGQHRGVGDRVDGQQRVVGDDDVGVAGLVARLLREAVGAERAARRADALPRRYADLTTTTGPAHRASARRGRRCRCPTTMRSAAARRGPARSAAIGVEQLLLRPVLRFGRRAVVNLVEAQVVSATLQQRELRAAGQRVGQ